jgi:desampylase
MWGMQLFISRHHIEQLIEYAREAHPLECCGLLLGDGEVLQAVQLTANRSPMPGTAFEIDPATLLSAQKLERAGGMQVIGYFHSHPNGLAEPSQTDAKMAVADGRYWLIIAENQVAGWRAVENGTLHNRFVPINLISQVETLQISGH